MFKHEKSSYVHHSFQIIGLFRKRSDDEAIRWISFDNEPVVEFF